MAAKKKNSLVNNINKRKKAGKSRPKSKSHVSEEAYGEMKKGWPHSAKTITPSVHGVRSEMMLWAI